MENLKKLDAGQLKIIAYISMVCDHFNKAVLLPYLYKLDAYSPAYSTLVNILGAVGTWAFPIFCYLLVESTFKTKNLKRFLLGLIGGALISEIPFDLATYNTYFEPGHQNIFFSMSMIVCLIVINEAFKKKWPGLGKRLVFLVFTSLIIAYVAEITAMDFGFYAIFLGAIFYMGRSLYLEKETFARWVGPKVVGFLLFMKELTSFPTFALLCLYNGKRGTQSKWLNYLFYPGHFVILWLIAQVLVYRS